MATRTLTINDLPNEILLLIFIKGCEELSDTYEIRPRGLKPFASLIRSVNRRWKELIDLNPDNGWSFWIARLCLDVGLCEEDYLGSWNPIPFAKILARFRHQLVTSQGCDLEIIFVLPRSDAWVIPFESLSLSQISSSIIKLLLHAMEYMSPYSNQVSLLRVLGNQPHAYLHLLGIIADGRWKNTQRLTELSFEQTNSFRNMSDTIPELASLYDVPTPFRLVLQPEHSRSLGSVNFSSLHNLETLVVPVASWLGPEFQLPTNLKHLRIAVADAASIRILSNYLTDPRQRPLCKNLRSLVVGTSDSWRWGTSAEGAERADLQWSCSKQISLPLLRSITMNGATAEHARKFLENSNFPSLEVISIDSAKEMHVEPLSFSEEQSATISEPGALEVPLLSVPVHDLQTLRLKQLAISTTFLACFPLFMDSPLEKLTIGYSKWYGFGEREVHPWNLESDTIFADRLSKFHPRCLGLHSISYRNALFIIRALETQHLRTLTMSPLLDSADTTSHSVLADLQPNRQINLPSLRSLTWSGDDEHITYFLCHLDAACLEWLSIITLDPRSEMDFGDWDRESTLRSNSFLAVKRIRYTLSFTDPLPDHWELFPNVEELSITLLHLSPPSSPEGAAEFKDLKESLTTIIRHLCMKPGSEGREIPFPQLRLVSISFQRSQHSPHLGLHFGLTITEEQVRVMIGSILEAHQNLDTPRFILNGPVRLSSENERQSWWDVVYRKKIEVEFLALAQMDEARDQRV